MRTSTVVVVLCTVEYWYQYQVPEKYNTKYDIRSCMTNTNITKNNPIANAKATSYLLFLIHNQSGPLGESDPCHAIKYDKYVSGH